MPLIAPTSANGLTQINSCPAFQSGIRRSSCRLRSETCEPEKHPSCFGVLPSIERP
jgi:hypothetical protein